LIYFIVSDQLVDRHEGRKFFYTDLHHDLIDYLRKQGSHQLVQNCDYVFRIINGQTVYLKDRKGLQYQFEEEELVVLRLSATKI
jgi:hypothetical protein